MTRIIVAFKLPRNRDFTHEPESADQLANLPQPRTQLKEWARCQCDH
jgi:hypothetical protein